MLLLNSCKHKNPEAVFIVDNNLSKIPDSVFLKENLSILSISQEGFTLYPPLSSLGSDSISKMPLNKLPEQLGELKNLEYLKISGSAIKKLPSSFSKLKNIEKLDISLNSGLKIINEIDKLKKLPQLKYLNIFGTDFSEQELEIIKKTLNKRVKIISTINEFLEEIPKYGG